MAFGKNSRTDSRRSSSSYCSTVTLVVFVALCLVGVWMMTSSAVVPGQPVDLNQENKVEVKEEPPVMTDPKQFEDSPGDLPEDAIRGDTSSSSQDEIKENPGEQIYEKPVEEKKDEVSMKENEDGNGGSDDAVKNPVENEGEKKNPESGEANEGEPEQMEQNGKKSEEGLGETLNDENGKQQSQNEKEENSGEGEKDEKEQSGLEEKVQQDETKESEGENKEQPQNEEKTEDPSSAEVFPDGAQSEILNETNVQSGAWKTQAKESKDEKDAQESKGQIANGEGKDGNSYGYSWKLCNVTAGTDFIPCLDNEEAIKKLHSTKHYEHRERHCPEQGPTCLVPLPQGYQKPIAWPTSRDKIWYHNVPHTKLAEVKGHQNWVKFSGEYLIFPGGGTQFKHGALHYIDFIQEAVPDIAWGKRSRVVLDVGCGVASFGGYLFDRDVLTMSFAPKDEHEAQVQFALERGIPAISAVMGTQRLPFPSRVFDIVHCARCRVPWHIEGGKLLLELNRVLRPGGYFVWSATPVYQKLEEDVGIWNAMKELTKAMCWDLVTVKKDAVNNVGAAIYRKPSSNECYEKRAQNNPPLCEESDDPNAAWYVPLQACMHRVPVDPAQRGSNWPEQWPQRVEKPPYWLNSSQVGVYGKAAPDDFQSDYKHWTRVVSKSYLKGMGISWSDVRNVMDMRSVYGGFAAALKDMNIWVMNVVSIDSPDTLPIIYERGMFGIYHDWCESFSTYPRTYDLLHADHLFSKVQKRCNIVAVMAEVDRILRPEGKMIVRDNVETIGLLENLVKSLKWEVRLTYSKDNEGLLCVKKTTWRPTEVVTSMSSMA